MRAVLLAVAVLGLTACASAEGPDAVPPTRAGELPDVTLADDDLQVTVDRGDGSQPLIRTVSCQEPASGSHPDAEAACDRLRALEGPFAPLPDDLVCTEQYGGPQTAHVIGRWNGEQVDAELSRVDGCRISQWDALVPLVPAADGAVPVD